MSRRWRSMMLVVAAGVLALALGLLQGSAFGGPKVLKISKVKPAKAEVGTVVDVKGKNFEALGVTAVKFNGITAVFTVESNKLIHATVPVGATTGSVSIVGGTPLQTVTTKDAFTVSYEAPFTDCLKSGNANIPGGTDPYVGATWMTKDSSYVKPFHKSTTTSLMVNGVAVKNPARYWDKHGEYVNPTTWNTYWAYDPGIVVPKGGTMTLVFHVIATQAFSDGFSSFATGVELFPGPTCVLHGI